MIPQTDSKNYSDVVSAADYLRNLPQVDPNCLFVTGYSAGGTLTMLASELWRLHLQRSRFH
jgi:dipeptidyl aminopeptidase/acylaminoacyl peptidase